MPIRSASNIRINDPDTGKQITIQIPDPLNSDVTYTLSTDGGTLGGGGGGGANTALSNLASVAVNTDLLFNTGTIARTKTKNDSANTKTMQVRSGDSSAGNSGAVFIGSGSSNILTGEVLSASGDADTLTGQSGDVTCLTGQGAITGSVNLTVAESTAGNSGNIKLEIGAATGGTRGKIKFVDGSEGTAGHVWTSSGTTGEGGWAAPAASGANTALSNLASTAVNASIIPANSGDVSLGATDKAWDKTYTNNIHGADSQPVSIGAAGALTVSTDANGGGSTASITIVTGVNTGGSPGSITLGLAGDASTDGISVTPGEIDVSSDAGSGSIEVTSAIIDFYGDGATNTTELLFWDKAQNESVGLKAPEVAVNSITYTLPPDDGNPGDVLTTDGAGVMSWGGLFLQLPTGSSDPAGVAAGSVYFNTGDGKIKVYTGSGWETIVSA